jgi:hypothetical protein
MNSACTIITAPLGAVLGSLLILSTLRLCASFAGGVGSISRSNVVSRTTVIIIDWNVRNLQLIYWLISHLPLPQSSWSCTLPAWLFGFMWMLWHDQSFSISRKEDGLELWRVQIRSGVQRMYADMIDHAASVLTPGSIMQGFPTWIFLQIEDQRTSSLLRNVGRSVAASNYRELISALMGEAVAVKKLDVLGIISNRAEISASSLRKRSS